MARGYQQTRDKPPDPSRVEKRQPVGKERRGEGQLGLRREAAAAEAVENQSVVVSVIARPPGTMDWGCRGPYAPSWLALSSLTDALRD